MKKQIPFLIGAVFTVSVTLSAQTPPIAEFEGRVSIGLADDTTTTAIGYKAAENFNPTGLRMSTFLGHAAGSLLENSVYNTFIGSGAGSQSTSAGKSVVIGHNAGRFLEGSMNVIIGNDSGRNVESNGNTFVGDAAGNKCKTGSHNSFFGYQSGLENTTGMHNTCDRNSRTLH